MDTLFRIVDGELAPDELAALTLVLVARAANTRAGADEHPHRRERQTRTRWRRLGPAGDYRSPVSWR
ncbi:acyl-CoA carboxylase subunit epsilon [Micromonospora sp. KC606]|uniref:acyl-CoA carboxylase subunit epsilon n=1 Tax=Micromonospora sp. KC606 TaxID=2530379 RepID=UPI001044C330|nr:acyl-CoA carboxylase subunit epsilon [Micromonospora sp. KC606]TDC85996.1 acyl-CoA carboxylase subunit epsilon [Micromonospora sp. KC606]